LILSRWRSAIGFLSFAWAPSSFWMLRKWNVKTFILTGFFSAKMKVFISNAIADDINMLCYFNAFSK
jgi:hypothetical protein